MASLPSATGLVLSGGGARGAYEAGVVAGIMDVLGRRGQERAPFDIFSGTSVGAINATWLAAHADRADMDVFGLLENWRRLVVDTHLRLDLPGLLGGRTVLPNMLSRLGLPLLDGERWGRSLLDSRALEELVRTRISWRRLHDNVRDGTVRALVIAALQISTGRTGMFAELAPGLTFRPSRDPRRFSRQGPLGSEHVLASAAIPFLFPARRIGASHYCDGGLRFNTPIAPAIRCGARRLVVVSLLHRASVSEERAAALQREAAYPSPMFLFGKVLNALLLDPLDYDLHMLERFNRLMDTLHDTLSPDELASVQRVLEDTRGLPYRKLDALVFRPSQDIGRIASERARHLHSKRPSSQLLARVARLGTTWEADLLSFILFDGEFAEQLIAMGRRDALERASEIEDFFSGTCSATAAS